MSRRNGCTVRIIQGAWRSSEGVAIISGSQRRTSGPGKLATAMPPGRPTSQANDLGDLGSLIDIGAARSDDQRDRNRQSRSNWRASQC
jgi:hypothetical protein